jgi:hypothetical protein
MAGETNGSLDDHPVFILPDALPGTKRKTALARWTNLEHKPRNVLTFFIGRP